VKIKVSCDKCQTEFLKYKSKLNTINFCSKKCFDDYRVFTINKECKVCGSTWIAVGANSKEAKRLTCSAECSSILSSKTTFKAGFTPWNKHGWRRTTQGYIEILMPDHPRSNKQGYVKQSILVMENFLGRHLEKEEVVHHKDRNKTNDVIDNLILFASNSDHVRFHYENGDCPIQGAPVS
jgi:hypothetical protein